MFFGILSGMTWALETIVLGVALTAVPFVDTEKAVFLAPFVSTFLHDFFSAVWSALYNGVKGNLPKVWHSLTHTKSGKYVVMASIIGGSVGMTGYVLCVNYMGAAIGAVASAIYPAIGAVFAFFFLKEKMQWYRWILLIITLSGVYGLSYSPELNISNFALGVMGALMCSFGWGIEAVILAKCLKDEGMSDEYALQIRQTTSAVASAVIILPALGAWGFTFEIITKHSIEVLPLIALAALFATISYLFYYRSIAKIGASKAMALNVSYSAWAIVFSVVLFRDTSLLTLITISCTLIVIICGILAAADIHDLLKKE